MEMERKAPKIVGQGEFAVGSAPDELFSAVLGSCVSVCLWDPEQNIGGMNHILLPTTKPREGMPNAFGVCAMELLINALVKKGAEKHRLQAKIFGGASVVKGLSDIGKENTIFVKNFLSDEKIPCIAESTGGTSARHVRFWPHSGRARQRISESGDLPAISVKPQVQNDVELF